MNLARDVKDDKKDFCEFIGDKRNTRENVGPLMSKKMDLVTQTTEKAEVLDDTFTSVFTSKTGFQASQVPETSGNG